MAWERRRAERTRLALLGVFMRVLDQGSISAAARALGISQPTASAGLHDLERRLGLDLLVRGPRGTHLTETGSVVAAWAREVVEAADRFEESVASLRTTARERLRVAASMTVAEYLAPRWLAVLARQGGVARPPDVERVVRN
jgi:molybdate transport repressor ModE-like protein